MNQLPPGHPHAPDKIKRLSKMIEKLRLFEERGVGRGLGLCGRIFIAERTLARLW